MLGFTIDSKCVVVVEILGFAEMASKIQAEFKDHGWWITGEEIMRPNVWITEFPILHGRHWSALGRAIGVLQSVTSSPNGLRIMEDTSLVVG